MTRLLTCFVVFVFTMAAALGAQSPAVIQNATGNDILTIQTADNRFRLVIEHIEGNDKSPVLDIEEDEVRTLSATMFAGEGETEKSLWRIKIPGEVNEYNSDDSVIVSPQGDFFVAIRSTWSFENPEKQDEFRVYTTNGVKRVPFGSLQTNDILVHELIFKFEVISKKPTLRIWDHEKNRWIAFMLPDGAKLTVTTEQNDRWNAALRQEILDAIAQRKMGRLRDQVQQTAPQLARLTSFLGSEKETLEINDLHYQFLLCRRQPEDRKIFEVILNARSQQRLVNLWGSSFASWTEGYFFRDYDREREIADAILGEWDGKRPKGSSIGSEDDPPYLLARASGTVNLPVPITVAIGALRVHLVPEGKQNGQWASDANVCTLEAAPRKPWSEQSDLAEQVQFEFRTVHPGKYFLKAVWDKRRPFDDVTKAGPGDYESKFFGPIALSAGSCISNLTLFCTNQVNGGEPYYAADAATRKAWLAGDLSPVSFDPQQSDVSWPAWKWIVVTNHFANGSPKLTRLAVGDSLFYDWRGSQLVQKTNTALKIYFDTSGAITNPFSLAIIDAHGCEFSTGNTYDWNIHERTGRSAQFLHYPQDAQTFRLLAWEINGDQKSILFDYTITNLLRTNIAAVKGEPLPVTKDLGPVSLSIQRIEVGKHDFKIDHVFKTKDGGRAAGWKLLDREICDANGVEITGLGLCREAKSIVVRFDVARNAKTAPHRWTPPIQELPDERKFVSIGVETNLLGIPLIFHGVAGAGRTLFRLPIEPVQGTSSTSEDDVEVSITDNIVKTKSARRLAVIEAPEHFAKVVIYVRGSGRLDKGMGLSVDRQSRLYFIPLKDREGGESKLEFAADEKIPVELAVDPSKNFRFASQQSVH